MALLYPCRVDSIKQTYKHGYIYIYTNMNIQINHTLNMQLYWVHSPQCSRIYYYSELWKLNGLIVISNFILPNVTCCPFHSKVISTEESGLNIAAYFSKCRRYDKKKLLAAANEKQFIMRWFIINGPFTFLSVCHVTLWHFGLLHSLLIKA
jgi:hypothetical protein